MTSDDKIRHLLRRFGFGASAHDLQAYAGLSTDKVLEKLLAFPDAPADEVPVFRFAFRPGEDAEPGFWRFRLHWLYEMLVTAHPLREKLAVFWHDHFAVSTNKVEHSLILLHYQQDLRRLAGRPFGEILLAMARSPAMMAMLDVKDNSRARPNENWGRELVELYTLGIGHYTEEDIKEISRAFTGWSYIDTFYEMTGSMDDRLRTIQATKEDVVAFAYVPSRHDNSPKKILGKTQNWTGEQVLEFLDDHPQTARHLSGKLWTYFAGTEPTDSVVEALAKAWRGSKGDPRAMIRAIADRPEFWSPECVGRRVKSPLEFAIGTCRAMAAGSAFREAIEAKKPFDSPIPQPVLEQLFYLSYQAQRMGQELLSPPDVAGWEWGRGWISADAMMWRGKFGPAWSWVPKPEKKEEYHAGPTCRWLAARMKDPAPKSVEEMAERLQAIFDVRLGESGRAALIERLTKSGGLAALANDDWLWGVSWQAFELLRVAPEYQLC